MHNGVFLFIGDPRGADNKTQKQKDYFLFFILQLRASVAPRSSVLLIHWRAQIMKNEQ